MNKPEYMHTALSRIQGDWDVKERGVRVNQLCLDTANENHLYINDLTLSSFAGSFAETATSEGK